MKKHFIVIIILSIIYFSPFDLISNDIKIGEYPELLSSNYAGKDYWFTIPPPYSDETPSMERFIKLFFISAKQVKAYIEVPGRQYLDSISISPLEQAEFIIRPEVALAFTKKGNELSPREAVYNGFAIHVYSKEPVILYCMVKYNRTSDGFLVWPVSLLGKEYNIASYDDMTENYPGYELPSICGIVATQDDTDVDFILGGNILTTTPLGMKPGEKAKQAMNKGDVWMISTTGDGGDLSGSYVNATKPVAVVSGNQCANIPKATRACDYIAEMQVPKSRFGYNYIAPIQPNRSKAPFIRIFPRDDKTSVYINGVFYKKMPFPYGKIEDFGFFDMRITLASPASGIFSGDKPINIMLYATSSNDDINVNPKTDPFEMQLIPIEEFQNEITFCTPGTRFGTLNFDTNYVQIVFETDNDKIPADLIIEKIFAGEKTQDTVKIKYKNTFELVPYAVNGKKYGVKVIILKDEGIYTVRCSKPFACYQFGVSTGESYGMAAYFNFVDPFLKDKVKPVPTWKRMCDGSVTNGSVTDMPADSNLRSNLLQMGLVADSSNNYEFTTTNFNAGDRTGNWKLNVLDHSKDAKATVKFTDRGGNDTIIEIKYYSNKLETNPKTIDLGRPAPLEKVIKKFTIVNPSNMAFRFDSIKMKNIKVAFDYLGAKLPVLLNPGDSLPTQLTFTVPKGGLKTTDTIMFCDTCLCSERSFLKISSGPPLISVTDADFNNVAINLKRKMPLEVRNTGDGTLFITGYNTNSDPAFTHNITYQFSVANPYVLAPDSAFKFEVEFLPTQTKTYKDKITFHSNSLTGDSIAQLNGIGEINDVFELINNDDPRISIVPNPVTGDAMVTVNLLSNIKEIFITDLFGNRIACCESINGNETGKQVFKLDVAALSQGAYFLRVVTGRENIVKKFIVNK